MSVATVDAPSYGTVVDTTRRARVIQTALYLAPIAFLLFMGWQHRWVEEDAFLNFRVVDQIRAGHGAVFNIGERVEAFTSTLWLGMLLVARSVLPFVHIEYLSIAGGLLLTALGLWWAQRGAAALWDRAPVRTFVPLGAVVVAVIPASWDWATSGLENGLSIAWLGALMLVLARFPRRGDAPPSVARTVATGVLIGLGPLVRPDLTIMSVVVGVALLWTARLRRDLLIWFLGGFFALPVLYEVFRAGYYGTLVPNTALAKDSSGAYWSQGWNYLVDLVEPYWLLVPLVVVAVCAVGLVLTKRARPELVVLFALPVAGLLHALFIVESGGDYLHARLLLPSLFAVMAPFAVVPWQPRFFVALAVVGVWAVVVVVFLRPDIRQELVPVTRHNVEDGRALMTKITRPGHRPVLASDFRLTDGPLAKRLQARGKRDLVVTGLPTVRDVTPERTTLLSSASGVSGYRAGPDVIVQEVNSLADPVGSRMTTTPANTPGHRKREEWPWILALTTRPGVEQYLDLDRVDASEFRPPPLDPDAVRAARRAIKCGALGEVVDATRDELTLGRFWSNLTGAIGRTRLVVPRDPFAAERKFCGS
jgi:arabinofuranosyltransferase